MSENNDVDDDDDEDEDIDVRDEEGRELVVEKTMNEVLFSSFGKAFHSCFVAPDFAASAFTHIINYFINFL